MKQSFAKMHRWPASKVVKAIHLVDSALQSVAEVLGHKQALQAALRCKVILAVLTLAVCHTVVCNLEWPRANSQAFDASPAKDRRLASPPRILGWPLSAPLPVLLARAWQALVGCLPLPVPRQYPSVLLVVSAVRDRRAQAAEVLAERAPLVLWSVNLPEFSAFAEFAHCCILANIPRWESPNAATWSSWCSWSLSFPRDASRRHASWRSPRRCWQAAWRATTKSPARSPAGNGTATRGYSICWGESWWRSQPGESQICSTAEEAEA